MKNIKGFTLIELIAVVTLLALIVLVTVPVIINTLSNTEEKEYEDFKKLVTNAAELYVERNRDLYPELNDVGGAIDIKVDILISEGYLKSSLTNPIDDKPVSNYKIVVSVNQDEIFNYEIYERNNLVDLATISKENGVEMIDKCATSGKCEPGTAFAIKVNEKDIYKFRVLKDENNVVTLLMSSNLYDQTNGSVLLAWNAVNTDNSYGPLTALEALKTRTLNWTNIKKYSYELDYGTGTYSGEFVQNVRARMPKLSDLTVDAIGCTKHGSTCPEWILEGLYGTGDDNTVGYWLSDAFSEVPSYVWDIEVETVGDTDNGVLSSGTINYAGSNGIRPVIEISRY